MAGGEHRRLLRRPVCGHARLRPPRLGPVRSAPTTPSRTSHRANPLRRNRSGHRPRTALPERPGNTVQANNRTRRLLMDADEATPADRRHRPVRAPPRCVPVAEHRPPTTHPHLGSRDPPNVARRRRSAVPIDHGRPRMRRSGRPPPIVSRRARPSPPCCRTLLPPGSEHCATPPPRSTTTSTADPVHGWR